MDNFPAFGEPITNTVEFLQKLAETVQWLYETQFDCMYIEGETFTVYPICDGHAGKVYKANGTKGNSGFIVIRVNTGQMMYTPNEQRDIPIVKFV